MYALASAIQLPYNLINYYQEQMQYLIEWLKHPQRITSLAVGGKDVIDSKGKEYFWPNLQRKVDVEDVWKHFAKEHYGKSTSTFICTVKIMTGCQREKMSALDVVSITFGYQIFKEIHDLLIEMVHKLPNLAG